jgi:argininosuccinate lyase
MTPRKKKSWQSRMTNEQNMLAVNFVESITFDNRLYTYDIAGSIAHATMLSEIKLITKSDLIKIKKAFKEIEKEIAS